MIETQIRAAVSAARTHVDINGVAKVLWRAHGAGMLDDAAAEAVVGIIEAKRATMRAGQAFGSPPAPARRPPRSPDRQASLERRRRCAASGAVPPRIAASFTTAELAVLAIVAGEVRRRGVCSLYLDVIAALAGVSRSSAKSAIRHARKLGILSVQERRRRGRKSDSNVVRVVSAEWHAWLKLARSSTTQHRGQNADLHAYRESFPVRTAQVWGRNAQGSDHPPIAEKARRPHTQGA